MELSRKCIFSQIEALGINGAAAARNGNVLGFRGIPLLPGTGVFDDKLPIKTMVEKGPYDPRDRFNHVSFQVPITERATKDFLHLEFHDQNAPFVNSFPENEAATIHFHWFEDGDALYARYTTDNPVDMMLLFNGALSPAGVLEIDASKGVLKQQEFQAVLQVAGDLRTYAAAGDVAEAEARVRGCSVDAPAKEQVTAHCLRLTPEHPVYIRLGTTTGTLEVDAVNRGLRQGEAKMQETLSTSSGSVAHCADALQRLVGYSKAYQPHCDRWCVPVNRDWSKSNRLPPTFMWDNFFDSYLAVWSQPELAKQSLSYILDIIETKGMAGAPPQRNLIVPVVYSKLVRTLGDKSFARESFSTMMKFMRFWFEDRGDGKPRRDGNDDGLIECGSCHQPGDQPLHKIVQNAFDETGYDDSPMYSDGFAYQRRALPADGVEYDFDRSTLNLTMIGQNSLYVAACRAMAVVAEWLGRDSDRQWLFAEAGRVSGKIREKLFDDFRGFYMNRFFDGSFSTVKTMTIFYPLLIDICDDTTKARLKETLLDPQQFWGENIIPTVSRDDPAYKCDPWRDPYWLGNYWRGNIWAPTNYITYLALRNSDWHDAVTEFAEKSKRLFMDDWLPRHHAMENYPPVGNTPKTKLFYGNGGRGPHYIWGGLLPMIALEQLFSVEDTAKGIRFGTLDEREFGSWKNFCFRGRRCSIDVDQAGVRLSIPEILEFSSERPLKVRRFDLDTGSFEYQANAETPAQIYFGQKSTTKILSKTDNWVGVKI